MDIHLQRMLMPAVIVLISSAALLIVRGIAFRLLTSRARTAASQIDDLVFTSLRAPSIAALSPSKVGEVIPHLTIHSRTSAF